MQIQVIQRKAAARKEIGRKVYEISMVHTLRDLLLAMCEQLYNQQYHGNVCDIYQHEDTGKIVFGMYNQHKEPLSKAKQTILQDYEDGLFRVFVRGEEVKELDEELRLKDPPPVVWIKMVMLTGRLW